MDFDEVIESNLSYFKERCDLISNQLVDLKTNCHTLVQLLDIIEKFASFYDFDNEVQGNGYRSFVETCRAHIDKANELCRNLKSKYGSFWFSKQKWIKWDREIKIERIDLNGRSISGNCKITISRLLSSKILLKISLIAVTSLDAFSPKSESITINSPSCITQWITHWASKSPEQSK